LTRDSRVEIPIVFEINRREAEKLLAITDDSDWAHSPARARALAAAGDWKAAVTELGGACSSMNSGEVETGDR
jgi:hypothetical protein